MEKTINEVRQEILKEFSIDISTTTIRRAEDSTLFKPLRSEVSGYRVYNEETAEKIKMFALLRDIGMLRADIKIVMEMDKQMAWDKINRLANVTIPALKARL